MNIKNEVLIRVYIVLALVVLVALIIFGKAVQISVFEGDKWRRKGEQEHVKFKPVKADRGNILAEDGSLLATSLPFFDIHMDLNSEAMPEEVFMEHLDTLAHCLANHVDNSYTVGGFRDRLLTKRLEGERYLLLQKNVNFAEKEKIGQFPLFNLGRYRGGLIVESKSERSMPFGMLAHRTLGSVRDGAKSVGLEGRYNNVLGGIEGKQLMQYVGSGNWIPVNDLTEIEPEHGADIVSTLNVDLQDITQEALLRGLNHHKAEHGCAILMEVKTGAIRAISNIGQTEKGGWWETYNHAIGSRTEPGSTFKLASMMALLEDDLINLDGVIDLEQGRAEFYEEIMEDASFHQLDSTTIRHAFEISSNVGISKLIQKHYGRTKKGDQFIRRLKQFNLHLKTGIEIDGELDPYIKEAYSEEDDWSGTTLPWMSIGYELTITPLQLLSFYNAVANNGQMMKPYLVSDIQNFGETIEHIKPTVVKRKIASEKTIALAKELLESVVENGTAKSIYTENYRIAGKTGTAQINYKKGQRNKDGIKYQTSFVGYFPADDPVYSCIVVVTDPKENGHYGSKVAAPIFREIADKCYLSRIEMHQAINKIEKPIIAGEQLPKKHVGHVDDIEIALSYLGLPFGGSVFSEWAVVDPDTQGDTLSVNTREIVNDFVPNVVGMGLRDALFVLENQKLQVEINGSGHVAKQSVLPGSRIRGQTVKLTLR